MKVAVIRQECSYRKGGAERYAANLCKALAGMGHEVWVLAETFDPGIHPGLRHVPVRVNRRSSASRSESFHANSQAAVAGLGADAVLALSRSFPADAFRVSDPLHRYWMEIRYPGKVQRMIQGLNPRHRAILRLEEGIFDPANTRMIITNSQMSKDLIGRYYRYPAERIEVVYNGVDLEQFCPVDGRDAAAAVRLLFVGQDFKRKGLAAVIEALGRVRAQGLAVELRGVGRDRSAPYRRQAAALGLSDCIDFQGPSGSIQQAYQQADLFIFPTHYDPFANVCLEAMACGLPVVTTTTNGAAEIISPGVDGYVIDGRGDLAGQMAAQVAKFCALDASKRAAMRVDARRKAEGFSIAGNAEKVISCLSRSSA